MRGPRQGLKLQYIMVFAPTYDTYLANSDNLQSIHTVVDVKSYLSVWYIVSGVLS
jgi:hypothetical protein